MDLGVGEFLLRSFSNLRIAEGAVRNGQPDTPELAAAWREAGFLLHSSGSGFPACADVNAWRIATGKPYGVFPVSTDPVSGIGSGRLVEGGTLAELRAASLRLPPNSLSQIMRNVIDHSSFMFCRDTISLNYLRAQGVKPPLLAMGPDTQFGMTLKDTTRGEAYLRASGLDRERFICVIPRLRYTMHRTRQPDDDIREKINNEHVQHDMQMLVDVMVQYIKATGNKVLVCPEMTYQIELGKKYLVDPFPTNLKSKVVWRDTYWLPDEAAAVYANASAVVSIECHSPIISLVQTTPTFYVRQPTDTCKGQMYPDLGLGDWLFEIDKVDGSLVWQRLKHVLADPRAAHAKATAAMSLVHHKQEEMGNALRQALSAMDKGAVTS
jgi:polysaccharide pyruvyl transferase WcaK-like protein